MGKKSLLFIFFILLMPVLKAQDVYSKYHELNLALHPDGAGWQFRIDKDTTSTKKKKVLLIGDSVLNGYSGYVINALSGDVIVDMWTTGLYESHPDLFPLLQQVSSFRKYDVIHFNIGLHGWAKGRIKEKEYSGLMSKYVDILRKNNPEAVIIWATSTPIMTKNDTVPDSKLNKIIVRHNKKANKVMKSKNVLINDLYGLTVRSYLSYTRGDGFHWKKEAQEAHGAQVIKYIKENIVLSTKAGYVLPEGNDKNIIIVR